MAFELSEGLIVQLARKWKHRLFDLENFAKLCSIPWESVLSSKTPSSSSKEAFAQALVTVLQHDPDAFLRYLEEVEIEKDPELVEELNNELRNQGLKISLTEGDWKISRIPESSKTKSISDKATAEITDRLRISEKMEPETRQSVPDHQIGNLKDPRKVFVVHGRNLEARDAVFTFLRSIGLDPIEWSQAVHATGKPNPYVGEVLDTAFSIAGAVLVLMTPDDEGRLQTPFRKLDDLTDEVQLTPQARLNVLFEAGMAMGRDPDRTVLVELGRLRPFSDIGGRHVIKLDDSTQKRQELAQRLQTAKCPVNLSGTSWHTAGKFSIGSGERTEDDREILKALQVPQRFAETTHLYFSRSIRQSRDEWLAERDSDPVGIDGGKRILERTSREILLFKSQIPEEGFADLHKRLAEILKNVKILLKHELYADGGRSYARFWQDGDRVFQELDEVLGKQKPSP